MRLGIDFRRTWQTMVLREPVERLYSHFNYFSGGKPELLKSVPIEDWPEPALRSYARSFASFYCDRLAKSFAVRDREAVRREKTLDAADSLKAAVDILEHVQLIGFTDRLEEFRAAFNRSNPLGLALEELPKERVGPRRAAEIPTEVQTIFEEELGPDRALYAITLQV